MEEGRVNTGLPSSCSSSKAFDFLLMPLRWLQPTEQLNSLHDRFKDVLVQHMHVATCWPYLFLLLSHVFTCGAGSIIFVRRLSAVLFISLTRATRPGTFLASASFCRLMSRLTRASSMS